MRKRTLIPTALAGALSIAVALSGFAAASAQSVSTSAGSLPFAFLYRENLSRGESGTDVASLQGFLSEMGFLTIPAGVAPGYFGPLTESALTRYQASLGVPATGTFDVGTKTAIISYLSSRYPHLSSAWAGVAAGTGTSGTIASNAPTMRPLGNTGYWYNGNWYNSVPTTTDSGVSGYWMNGVWYSFGSGSTGTGSGNVASASSNLGYWYNGAWYPADDARGGGFYSTNPALASGSSASASGYWYNGVWYPTSTANIGGGQSSDVDDDSDSSTPMTGTGSGYWLNGVWYSLGGGPTSGPSSGPTVSSGINYSTNLTPTGYWQNGVWYASVPTTQQAANSGIPGYWQNNTWYSLDSSQTTTFGTPNPTNPSSGPGYWQNGVWYSTATQPNAGQNGYWQNGVWYSTN